MLPISDNQMYAVGIMSEAKSTKISIREDRPTAMSSTAHGANLNAIGFNVPFIAARNPKLAIEIMKLYALAHKIQESDPQAPDEDFAMFANETQKLVNNDD